MIMSEQTIPIPGRLKNVAIGGHVAGSEDIDAGGGKTQKQVNDETNDTLALHQSEISGLNNQNYVSVSSYSSLPATGSADTIYRVSSWDGNANSGEGAVDVTKYTEYAWNGTNYIVISVKSQIGEVFDISEYKAIGGTLATFDNLSAALDNGNNVPAGIRKGGMSVKFVQSSDNKYMQFRYLLDDATTITKFTNTDNWSFCGDDVLIESSEFVEAKTDSDGKLIEARRIDGTKIEYGNLEVKGRFTNAEIQEQVDKKVDKEDNKSLIDSDFAEAQSVQESSEYIEAKVDQNNKLLEGIRKNATKVFGADVEIHGNMTLQGIKCIVLSNSEWAAVWVDADLKILFGFKTNGRTFVGDADFLNDIKYIKEKINIDEIDWDSLKAFSEVDNSEFISVETDGDNKVLGGRKANGNKFENMPIEMPAATIYSQRSENISEMVLDGDNKIIAYRKEEGTKVENVGLETPKIKVQHLEGVEDINGKDIEEIISNKSDSVIPLKDYNLPKYGSVNIKSETFYLTSPTPISDRSEVYIFQDYEATGSNYINKVTMSYYYLVSSLIDNGDGTYSKYNDGVEGHDIKLDFYAGKEVKKIDGVYYVKSSIGTEHPIVVYQIVGAPDLLTWAVNKDSEHYCLVDINFGTYLTANDMTVGVKFQGNSTIAYPKKNLRFTFYKNNEYSKKVKKQIGELIPASKYNLKAYWRDSSLVREHACYRIVQAIRETHNYLDQYPWNEGKGFVPNATGITNGFPIRIEVGGKFQGVYWFGLAKDIDNFMLDDETMNGVLIQGDGGFGPTFWQVLDPQYWSDILADIDNNIGEDSLPYVQAWYNYLNGNTFSRETAPAHFNIKNWIDCIIILQTFGAVDMTSNNIMLYAGTNKTIFSPMYYDMDWTWGFRCNWNMSTFSNTQTQDQSLWVKVQSILKDEIEARYKELRAKIINMEYINNLIVGFGRQIPYSDYEEEMAKWPDMPLTPTDEGRVGSIESILDWMQKRINFMDGYFHYNV